MAPEAEIERRKRRILEILFRKQKVTLEDLATYCTDSGYPIALKMQKTFMEDCYQELSAQKFPIEWDGSKISLRTMEMAERWKGTNVGKRLKKQDGMDIKGSLASKVLDILKENQWIKTVCLSSGTTIYKIAEKIFSSPARDEIAVQRVYTTSILCLDAFLFNKPSDMHLFPVGKEFDISTGAFKYYKKETLKELSIDALVVSFTALSEEGFYADEQWEQEEMLTLLRPDKTKLIIIPIGWGKINSNGTYLVESEEIPGTDVLDFPKNKFTGKTDRKYVLVTNPPDGNLNSDPEKEAVIKVWEKRGMNVEPVS